jgi:hypothetical protein
MMNKPLLMLIVCALVALAALGAAMAIVHVELGLVS